MDYPLTEEQIEKIRTFLKDAPSTMLYGRISEEYQESFDFLIYHRFIANSSLFAYNGGYSNQFHRVTTNSEILRQINEENTKILDERAKAERIERRSENIGKATLIVSILALIATIIGLFL